MDEAEIGTTLRDTLWVVIKLGGPLLIAALIVGLLISIIQAVTQINEATLVFLPKVLVLGVAFVLLAPSMIHIMTDYTHVLMDQVILAGGR